MSINIADYLEPNADQLSVDHLASGPRVVTIKSVKGYRDDKGKSRIELGLEEFDVPWRPCLTMARVLDKVWGGKDASTRYIGRKILLFNDESVMFGPQKTGGLRIRALSHIDKRTTAERLTVQKGRKSSYTVDPLPDEPTAAPPKPEPSLTDRIDKMLKAFEGIGVTQQQLEAKLNAPLVDWDADDVAQMLSVYTSITRDKANPATIFASEGLDGAEAER